MSLWRSESNDANLVRYLRKAGTFSFFSAATREKLRGLKQTGRSGCLGSLKDEPRQLLELWALVLTDALRGLKKRDSREWTLRCGIHFDSFFNEDSLGIAEFTTVVEGFADFESLLYGALPDRHRDHVAHSFRVWILGQRLLQETLGGSLRMDTGVGDDDSLAISTAEWECMWALTALCHDIGYPYSKVEEINKKATDTLQRQGLRALERLRFSFSSEMEPFYRSIMALMASNLARREYGSEARFLTHIQSKYYLKFLNSCDHLQHGVISSLLMSKSLVYFLESDLCLDSNRPLAAEDARQFLIRREMLRAVAAHTCPEIYHLRFDTLSFLLYIVDELQCWGRPTFEELQAGHDGFQDDRLTIESFGPDSIDIKITTKNTWSSTREMIAQSVLSGVNRRLRLAVDAKVYGGLSLRFCVSGKGGKGRELRLQDGKITHRQLRKAV